METEGQLLAYRCTSKWWDQLVRVSNSDWLYHMPRVSCHLVFSVNCVSKELKRDQTLLQCDQPDSDPGNLLHSHNLCKRNRCHTVGLRTPGEECHTHPWSSHSQFGNQTSSRDGRVWHSTAHRSPPDDDACVRHRGKPWGALHCQQPSQAACLTLLWEFIGVSHASCPQLWNLLPPSLHWQVCPLDTPKFKIRVTSEYTLTFVL